ncbi:helix-turn-helix transcriptional regulator [Kitasatospora kazusensis]|uniref:Helix-turn-helix transcriptional regulator n=2 Tax=Kitasatospora kazusensis TaxID=407974 RepID=A0ABP5M0D6_9ACTN
MGYTGTYISYLESARRVPTEAVAKAADKALKTGGTLELMWRTHAYTGLLEGFPEYAAFEARAAEVSIFELAVIPGLLQTKEYAAALADADVRRGTITQDQAAERVAFLMSRQENLDRSPRSTLQIVLDESCLRCPVGGSEVLSRQLAYLEVLSARPGIVLQVAPASLGAERPFVLPVTLLRMPDGATVGYTETMKRGFLERDKATLARWVRDYHLLQVEALSQVASRALISKTRRDICHMNDVDLTDAPWFKSSYSANGGQCIEVADGFAGIVPVRDSKDPEGPALVFPADAFASFVAAVKAGDFGAV